MLLLQDPAIAAVEAKPTGLLASFVRNIGVNVMGTQSLSREDIHPALVQFKAKLMERNVAEEIAAKCVNALLALLFHLSTLPRVLLLLLALLCRLLQ